MQQVICRAHDHRLETISWPSLVQPDSSREKVGLPQEQAFGLRSSSPDQH